MLAEMQTLRFLTSSMFFEVKVNCMYRQKKRPLYSQYIGSELCCAVGIMCLLILMLYGLLPVTAGIL